MDKIYDVIIIGSGMGGLTTASLLARDGHSVLILEAANIVGGCSSSFSLNNVVYETGATTLIGFDENQPLKKLEKLLGIQFDKEELEVSMLVKLVNGSTIKRSKDYEQFINDIVQNYGNEISQRKFWKTIYKLSNIVWELSSKIEKIPLTKINDIKQFLSLTFLKQLPLIKYLGVSLYDYLEELGIQDKNFVQFLDEQLMITAQSTSKNVPILFAAPALAYPFSRNFYVRGGMKNLMNQILQFYKKCGGRLRLKNKVTSISYLNNSYSVVANETVVYKSKALVSNASIWNVPDFIKDERLRKKSSDVIQKYETDLGAFSLYVKVKDVFREGVPLHYQVHCEGTDNKHYSIFISLSQRGDLDRVEKGFRAVNISTHADVEDWFTDKANYDSLKKIKECEIINHFVDSFDELQKTDIVEIHSATPLTWENWAFRKKGRVGGLVQTMKRSFWDWPKQQDYYPNFYQVGDTTFPGQGIPGVTLSGINVYHLLKKEFK